MVECTMTVWNIDVLPTERQWGISEWLAGHMVDSNGVADAIACGIMVKWVHQPSSSPLDYTMVEM